MYMDLSKIKKVYIIGIEGAGTSALARMFRSMDIEVSGSDDGDGFYSDMLASQGIKVNRKFDAANVPADADLIVYSVAFKPERNVETAQAMKGKVKTVTYGEAISFIFNHKYGIAVCGTHGKTTTTAWLSFVLKQAGSDPSMVVGSKVPQFGANNLVGKSDYFVLEADEYENKLQFLEPKGVLLNNIDYDHPDYFPDTEAYSGVFIDLLKRLPASGFLTANYDDPVIRKVAWANCRAKKISYAIDEAADYVAYDIKQLGTRQYFKVKLAGHGDEDGFEEVDMGGFSIQLPGRHNISNALAVIAASIELDIDLYKIRQSLEEFTGTARRMQVMGEFRGATIIDDYAHHPTEIKASLAGARERYRGHPLTVVFHPHTFTRTKALLDDFSLSFKDADKLIVLDIYGSAREIQGGVHSRDLVGKIEDQPEGSRPQEIKYIASLKEAEAYLRETARRDEVIILMGAGDVFRIGEGLVK